VSETFFYCPSLQETDTRATLTGDEARHASGARRLRPGDRVTLFDGRGLTASAELAEVRDRGLSVEFQVREHHRQPAPAPALHLACALPKGDRLGTLLDMGTQLGMSSFTPLRCEHSVVRPGDGASDRWRRIVLEACKQSRRAWLPEILPAAGPAEVARAAVARGAPVWIAHPDGPPPAAAIAAGDNQWFLIGPEGGFSKSEVTGAEAAGARRIGLGDGILRIETAAIALLAAARLCAGTGAK
jgi:16S rRNA (uracil1498-N3)-methyltransferase